MATTTTERKCVCGCYEKWHWRAQDRYLEGFCLNCPCRKFEPAGGDA